MGKNYAENSLKRFLKRKVKITLGVVVSFLITGMVAFAEGTAEKSEIVVKLEEQQGNYTTAKENLEELGAKIFENESSIETDNGYSITVKKSGEESTTKNIKLTRKDGKITIDASAINSNAKFSFDDRLVSEKVQKNIENALGTKEEQGKYIIHQGGDARIIAVNNSIVMHKNLNDNSSQSAGIKTDGTVIDTVINNGILFSPQSTALNNSKAINNGVIFYLSSDIAGGGQAAGVNIVDGKHIPYEKIELYNNGLIVSKHSGQALYKSIGAKIYNNGVISSKQYGQTTRGDAKQIPKDNKIYNYGIMETKLGGQYIIGGTNSILENYGTIVTEGVGQYTNGNTNKAYNYGLIKVTDGYAMSGAGAKYNYGVIKASGNSSIFNEGTTISKGIIITNGDTTRLTKYMENSAVFDTDYKLQNTNAKIISGKLSGNEFKEGENLAVIQNNSAELNGIFNDKTMASVITDDIEKPVFTLGEGETVLNNTNLVGYFENNNGGTLLKVDADKTLILDGKTNITAVKDLTSETKDVYALSLEKGSTLNLIGSDVKVNGIINGLTDTTINAYAIKGDLSVDTSGKLLVGNIQGDITSDYIKSQNVTGATISKNNETQTIKDLEFNFTNTTAKDEDGKLKENKVVIENGVSIAEGGTFTDKTEAGNDVRVEIENLESFAKNLDGIKLGAGNNTFVVTNANDNISAYAGTIDMGTSGNDEFKVINNGGINEFKYNVKNAETVSLSGGTWKIGDKGTIGFDKVSKAGNTPNINMADGAVLNITLTQKGSDLSETLKAGKVTNGEHLVLSTDDTSKIKYIISDEGIRHETLSTDTYSIDKNANVVAPIFNVSQTGNGGVQMSVKTAEEAGVGEYKPIYDAFVGAVTNGNAEKDVIDKINSMTSNEDIGKLINNTNVAATAYYTAGTVVTKNIIDSYSSAVENFGRRAEKGEWIAEGKFINSDTEFDGGSKVRGYEGDINSAVAMVEYGVSDTTSYGVAFGGGDTEVDINGGGKLEGDNYYVGAYMKHRTTNGVDVVANIGFVKSDLDSKLSNDFKLTQGKVDISGSSLVDGTADSNALAVSLRGRKDFQITDSIKLQPNLGARVTMISQDEASNPDMGFEVKAQDIFVVEGIVGFDVAKEFALADGKVELRAGVEYTALSSNQDHDAEYTLYGSKIELEDSELASTVGNAHVGVNYEHENGVGFNGKYEMMWSDSGDDSRITAGISYRF